MKWNHQNKLRLSELVLAGKTTEQISDILNISFSSVATARIRHVSRENTVTYQCMYCDGLWKGPQYEQRKFCKPQCKEAYELGSIKRSSKWKKCLGCDIRTTRSWCAVNCSPIKQPSQPKPEYTCSTCGKASTGYGKYCGWECYSLVHKQQLAQNRAENLKNGKLKNKTLRRYLLSLLPNICSSCQRDTWMNKPIPLDVDHKDGNSDNNLIENLRFLCPNCHSQTTTYKAKNKGSGREHLKKMKEHM